MRLAGAAQMTGGHVYTFLTKTAVFFSGEMSVSSVVLPGDELSVISSTTLGPGTRRLEDGRVCSSVGGVVRGKEGKTVWVDCNSKRYVPVKGDRVLGVVVKTGKSHRVDINAAMSASLPELAFQGATRRNKPALQVGDVVYAVISRAHPHIEPELSCMDGSGKADGLGHLSTLGYLLKCSLGLCRKLLSKPSPVLQCLGARLKFECVVGVNGRVWISSAQITDTILAVNAITSSEYMAEEECQQMVQQMLQHR